MKLVQRGGGRAGDPPPSTQDIVDVHGRSAEEVAAKISAFTEKYAVRAISMTMVYVPQVPASAFETHAIFARHISADDIVEGRSAEEVAATNPSQPETETPGPFQAVVIFEEDTTR